MTEQLRSDNAKHHWCNHPNRRHQQGRPTHPPELTEVHFHPDFQQKQDDPDLAQGAKDLIARSDQSKDGWPDKDASEDLTDNWWDPNSFGDLGRQLRRYQDNKDVA